MDRIPDNVILSAFTKQELQALSVMNNVIINTKDTPKDILRKLRSKPHANLDFVQRKIDNMLTERDVQMLMRATHVWKNAHQAKRKPLVVRSVSKSKSKSRSQSFF
jgi:hypothetical protein